MWFQQNKMLTTLAVLGVLYLGGEDSVTYSVCILSDTPHFLFI